MNNKRGQSLFVLLFAAISVFSQNWEAVKSNPAYMYGEGWGATVAEADEQALSDLISKISVSVTGDVSHEEIEKASNDGINGESVFRSSVRTYSQATLTNTQKIVIKNEPDAHVGRWIRRTEIDKIFEGRKHKIRDYVVSAINAEEKGKLDIALKDYYWALCLVKSLRYPSEMSYETDDGENVLLVNWIPRQLNDVFPI